jgi:hypothetical protein
MLALVALAAPAQAQPTIRVNTPSIFRWLPLPLADIDDSQTVRFEVQIDNHPIVTTANGVPTPKPIPAVEYQYPVPQAQMVLGPHTGRVRSCSVDECSPWHEGTVIVRPMMPPTPSGGGFKPVSAVVPPPVAVKMVHGYGWLAGLGRDLNDAELASLAVRYGATYPDGAIRDDRLRDLLDAVYGELVH